MYLDQFLSVKLTKFKMLPIGIFPTIACLLLILFVPLGAHAADEKIADLVVQATDTDILVSANLIKGFSPTSEEDIRNGIPKDLFYYVLLKRRQPLWFDEEMRSKTVKYTVKYDLLNKQFLVTIRSNGTVHQETMDDFLAMKRLISTINNVRIAGTDVLNNEDTYYVSVKAEMKASQLPFYLDYFLFFIPFLEVDTPWANSAPFYK
jgi:hypothetical protein